MAEDALTFQQVNLYDEVKFHDVISSIESKKCSLDLQQYQQDLQQKLKERETERIGREEYFGLRRQWSYALLACLLGMILFQMVLTFFIGFSLISFKDYKWFLYGIIAENFGQMIGMVIIVVKYLFPLKEKNLNH